MMANDPKQHSRFIAEINIITVKSSTDIKDDLEESRYGHLEVGHEQEEAAQKNGEDGKDDTDYGDCVVDMDVQRSLEEDEKQLREIMSQLVKDLQSLRIEITGKDDHPKNTTQSVGEEQNKNIISNINSRFSNDKSYKKSPKTSLVSSFTHSQGQVGSTIPVATHPEDRSAFSASRSHDKLTPPPSLSQDKSGSTVKRTAANVTFSSPFSQDETDSTETHSEDRLISPTHRSQYKQAPSYFSEGKSDPIETHPLAKPILPESLSQDKYGSPVTHPQDRLTSPASRSQGKSSPHSPPVPSGAPSLRSQDPNTTSLNNKRLNTMLDHVNRFGAIGNSFYYFCPDGRRQSGLPPDVLPSPHHSRERQQRTH